MMLCAFHHQYPSFHWHCHLYHIQCQSLYHPLRHGIFASAWIKEQKYWPKYIDGDAVDAYFADKAVGTTDSLEGKIHNIPFYTYTMKELIII